MTISYQTGDQTCRCSYLAPCVSFTSVHAARKAVESMDVTPGGLAVSCDNAGKLKVWTTDNGETRVSYAETFINFFFCCCCFCKFHTALLAFYSFNREI